MKAKKNSQPNPPAKWAESTPPPPTHEQIQALARALWTERGRPQDRDVEIWLEAERQLRGVVEPLTDPGRVDVDTSQDARIEREMDRVVGPTQQRSPTSL